MDLTLTGVTSALSGVAGSMAGSVESFVRSGPGAVQGTVSAVNRIVRTVPVVRDVAESRNVRILAGLLGPAYRGLVKRGYKNTETTDIALGGRAHFDWAYRRDFPEMSRLYEFAKDSQWNATKDLDWSRDIDPLGKDKLVPDQFVPTYKHRIWKKLNKIERANQRHAMLSWTLSQFLHGEQGALFAAAQVTEAVPWLDAKLFGATQVMDEGRHVEVFHRYLTQKLERRYEINDNLYVVIDAIMSDSRWDMKFLGMQIMIEGLALGSFGMIRNITTEPMLKNLLKYVITDEARHVHYGVLALQSFMKTELSERERRDREDWAFELTLLLRNRFLAHEIYDEYYAHAMTRTEWNRTLLESDLMSLFRRTMFKRIVPNLKRIGLLSDRVRPRYEAIGLLQYENEKSAVDLTARDMLA